MNLHLFTDSVFVSKIIDKCETYGENNHYVVFAPSLKYVTDNKVHHYHNYNEFKDSGFSFEKVTKIFIHYLGGYAVDFILDNKSLAPYYWFFWGADGYSLKNVEEDLLLPKTKQKSKGSVSFYQKWRWKLVKRLKNLEARKKEALRHIDYCCTWVKGDYEFIKDMGFTHLKFHFFSYLSENDLFDNELQVKDFKNNELKILAGNSLNVTNNHFEIIDFIGDIFQEKAEVIFPVSYSGPEVYKQKVISYTKNFSINATFLEEFIPMEKYLQIINDCDIVVFLHLRQQAANNSLSLLWMGKILIMHPESTLFQFFETNGLSVISLNDVNAIEDIKSFHLNNIGRLEKNREILRSLFSENRIEEMYKFLFK